MISGAITRDSDGQPVEGVSIQVWNYDTGEGIGRFQSQPGGIYTVTGLPSGEYRLMAVASDTEYASEYYNNATNWNAAERVSVTSGNTTDSINFSLGQGGSISGSVTRDSDGQAVSGVPVYVHDYYNGSWFGDTQTQSDGSYNLSGLPPGDYRIEVDPWNTIYSWEIYNNTYNYGDAEAVSVSVGSPATGKNFSLALAGSISGIVTREGSGEPLEGMLVRAQMFLHDWWSRDTRTDADGKYTIEGLPPTGFRVEVDPEGANFIREYYDNSTDYNSAKRVVVNSGFDTPLIDFAVAPGFPIIGTMMRVKKSNGEFITKYEIEIENFDGSLPDDIDTISIKAPSGTTLPYTKSDFTWWPQWQIFSLDVDGSPPELGVYTFTVTSGDATGTDTDFYYIERVFPHRI